MIPSDQKQLIGFNSLFSNIAINFNKNNLPNKILLSGKKGIGKSTFAYHLTNYILSKNEDFTYELSNNEINENNNSYKLIRQNTHPNFFKISLSPDKKNIEIQQIKDMINFSNKSSFYNKSKIVIIDNVESLNPSSSNALLKTLEEPNNNILFLLIYNNHFSLPETIKSRCIEFKLNLQKKETSIIVNKILGENIYDNFSADFLNLNLSPSFYLNFYGFCNQNEIDYSNIIIEDLLKLVLIKKMYNKDVYIKKNIKLFIEILFKKKYLLTKSKLIFDKFSYFNLKYNDVKNFNLDFETFMLEFNSMILNE